VPLTSEILMRNLLFSFFLIALLSACQKLPVYESQSYSGGLNTEAYQGNNSTYALSWNVYNDDESLVIDIATAHKPSIVKILRFGFQVSFDQKHDKIETYGINYPVKKQPSGAQSGNSGRRPSGRRPGQSQEGIDPNKALEHLPKRVEINSLNGNTQTLIDSLPKGYEIKLSITDEALHYFLKVPKADFVAADQSEVSIGFKSGAMERRMSSGGAGPGGGGKRPDMGSRSGGMSSQMVEMMEPIKIWFKAQLAG